MSAAPPAATFVDAPAPTATTSSAKKKKKKKRGTSPGGGGASVSPRVLAQRAQMHLLRRKLLPVIGLRRYQHARRTQRENIVAQLTNSDAFRSPLLSPSSLNIDPAASVNNNKPSFFLTQSNAVQQQQQDGADVAVASPKSPDQQSLVQKLLRSVTRDTVAGCILDNTTQLRHWGREALEDLVGGDGAALERFALPDEMMVYPNEMASSHGLIVLLHGSVLKLPLPATHVMKQHFNYLAASNAAAAGGGGGQFAAAMLASGAPTKSPLNLTASNAEVEVIRAPAVIGEGLILSETLSNYWLKAESYCQYVVVSGKAIHRQLLQQPQPIIHRTLSSDVLLAREVALRQHFSQTPPLLRRSWITKDMETRTLYRLMLDLEPRSFAPGEDIAVEGAAAPWMVFIRRGEADLMSNGVVVMKLTAGDTFGEMSVLFGEPRLNTLRSTTICDVWVLHRRSVGNVLRMADSQRSVVRKAAKMRRVLLEQLPRFHSHQPLRERVPYLRDMPDPIFEEMVQHSKAHVFPVGLLMVASSETCDALVLLVNGTAVEQDVHHRKFRAGDVLGTNCLIPHRWVYGISAATMVDSFILPRPAIMEALTAWGTIKQAFRYVELEMKELKRHLSKTLLLNPPTSNIATSTVMDRQALRSVLDGNFSPSAQSADNSSGGGGSKRRSGSKAKKSEQDSKEGSKNKNNNNNDDDDAGNNSDGDGLPPPEDRFLTYDERIERKRMKAKRQRFKLRTLGGFSTMLTEDEDNPFKAQINHLVGNHWFEKNGWSRKSETDPKKAARQQQNQPHQQQQQQQWSASSPALPPVSPRGRSPTSPQLSANAASFRRQSMSTSNMSGTFRATREANLTMSPLQSPRDFRSQLTREHHTRELPHNVVCAVEEAEEAAQIAATTAAAQDSGDGNNGEGGGGGSSALPLGLSDDDVLMLGALRSIWADPRYDRPFMDRNDVAAALAAWPSITHVYWLNQRMRDEDPDKALRKQQAAAAVREQLLTEALQSADAPELVKRDTVALPSRLANIDRSIATAPDPNAAPVTFESLTRRLSLVPGTGEQQQQQQLARRRSSVIVNRRASQSPQKPPPPAAAGSGEHDDDFDMNEATLVGTVSNVNFGSTTGSGSGGGGGTLSTSPSLALPYHARVAMMREHRGYGDDGEKEAPLVTAEDVERILGGILARVPARVRQQFEMDEMNSDKHHFIGSATHRMNASSSLSWLPSESNRDFLNEAIEDLSLSMAAQIPPPHNPAQYDEDISPAIPTTETFRKEQAALLAAKAAAEAAALGMDSNNSFAAGKDGDDATDQQQSTTLQSEQDEAARREAALKAALAAPVPSYARATGSSLAKQKSTQGRSHAETVAMQMRAAADNSSGGGLFSLKSIVNRDEDDSSDFTSSDDDDEDGGGGDDSEELSSTRRSSRSRSSSAHGDDTQQEDALGSTQRSTASNKKQQQKRPRSLTPGGSRKKKAGKDKSNNNNKKKKEKRKKQRKPHEEEEKLHPHPPTSKSGKQLAARLILPGVNSSSTKQPQHQQHTPRPPPPQQLEPAALGTTADSSASLPPPPGSNPLSVQSQPPRQPEGGRPSSATASSAASNANSTSRRNNSHNKAAAAPATSRPSTSQTTTTPTTPVLQKLESQIRKRPDVIYARPVYNSRAGFAMVPANTKQKLVSSTNVPLHRADAVSSPASSVSAVSGSSDDE